MTAQHNPSVRMTQGAAPGPNWRRALKSLLRPFFKIARALLRPILFRYRAHMLRPLQPMLDKSDATSRQLDLVSQQLGAISATLAASFSKLDSIPRQVDSLSREVATLRAALSSTDRQLAEARGQLTELTDNLATPDFLKSIDRLVVTLASGSTRK